MVLPVYPQEPKPDVPFEISYTYDILRSNLSFAHTIKLRRTFRPKRLFTLNYSFLTPEERDMLYNFFIDVNNSDLGLFYFITPVKFSFNKEYVAVVEDTNTKIYRLPLYSVDAINIYINNNLVPNTNYSMYFEYPSLYVVLDKVNLHKGDLITCDFVNGNLCLVCEFAENSLGLKQLVAGYSNISDLKIVEVLNYIV